MRLLEVVNLTVDELEAVRLADLEGLYQEAAAEKMRISRQTFGRILESAHKKIADALVNGKALSIEGGDVQIDAAPPPQGPLPHFAPGRHRGRGRGRGHCGGRGNC
jgi:predicted DNA-binding protein (UPF0251 family)